MLFGRKNLRTDCTLIYDEQSYYIRIVYFLLKAIGNDAFWDFRRCMKQLEKGDTHAFLSIL